MKKIRRVRLWLVPLLALFLYGTFFVPVKAAPEETASEKTAPEEAVPGKTAPGETVLVNCAYKGVPLHTAMLGVTLDDSRAGAVGGGLDAELVADGSFIGGQRELPRAWQGVGGRFTLETFAPFSVQNPSYLRIDAQSDFCEIRNTGMEPGMDFSGGERYALTFQARGEGFRGSLAVRLQDADGQALSETVLLTISGGAWRQYETTLTADRTAMGQLCLAADGRGAFALDAVSLRPENTYGTSENWPQGKLRADITQALRDLHPGFLSFPGNALLAAQSGEGGYRWMDSVGPLSERIGVVRADGSLYEMGFGFHEFLTLCAEWGVLAVPALYAGLPEEMSGEEWLDRPDSAELAGTVQDALDFRAYAGEPDTETLGGLRAANGHPEPFATPYIRIGGQHEGSAYFQNFAVFKEAFAEKYPDVTLIASSGKEGQGDGFAYAWREIGLYYPDVLAAEAYGNRTPEWLLANTERYDAYARETGAGVLVESFGAQGEATLWRALCEAAFWTGLERNGDIVRMASYGFLSDLIYREEGRLAVTPSYEMLRMFAGSIGEETIPLDMPEGLFGAASRAEDVIYIKLVNPYAQPRDITLKLENVPNLPGKADMQLLTGQPDSTLTPAVSSAQPIRRGQTTLALPAYCAAALTLYCTPPPVWVYLLRGLGLLLALGAGVLGLLILRARILRARKRKRKRRKNRLVKSRKV